MTAIVSPKPRLASRSRAQSPQPLLSPPSLYLATDLPRHMASASLASPPRLLSPIHLADSPSYYAKASSSCNTPQKRRTQSGATRNARRRHCARFDCAAFANGGSIFDQLAWIPQLHQEPERVDVWDIADLSLLPIEPFHHRASGVGPVRSRKLSLRSDPLSCGSSAAQDVGINRAQRRFNSNSVLPLFDRELPDPRTPPPRDTPFIPENVQFVGLMPALPINDEPSRSC